MEVRNATSGIINIKSINITAFVDSCRVCMVRNPNMSGIFDTESEHIVEEILFCTGVRLEKQDGLPTKICTQCVKDLTVAYKFKKSCILADKTFRKLVIDTDIKAERPEIVDENFEQNTGYEDDFEEQQVKEEVSWEPMVIRNMGKKASSTQKSIQSVLPSGARRRVGRPRKSTAAASCPLKNYKLKKLHCKSCDVTFTNEQLFEDHEKELHKDGDLWVKEEISWEPMVLSNDRNKTSVTQKSTQSVLSPAAKSHIGRPTKSAGAPRRMKKYKFRKLHCEPCDIKFTNKQQFEDHKKELHKDTDHWVCEICGKVFIHRASHYAHVKSHLPPQFACDQCDYKTWHKYDLVKHIRIHTGIKMYQCEYCTASYYTSSNLTGHIRRNHRKERPFVCTICPRTFFDRTKLNRHVDSHNEIKRFECEVCHACFTRRCYWKKHLLRQHDIVTPPQRPGRQKTNAVVGEDLIERVNLVIRPRDIGEYLTHKSVVEEFVIERVDKEV